MSLKDEGVLFSSKFLSDSNSLQYLDKYFEALASILMLNKSVDDDIGEDESVSKILKVFNEFIRCCHQSVSRFFSTNFSHFEQLKKNFLLVPNSFFFSVCQYLLKEICRFGIRDC